MNILIINWTWYPSGGDWTYVNSLCKLFESKGHKVIPFSMHDERNFETPYSKYFVTKIDYKALNKKKSIFGGIKVIFKTLYSVEAKRNLEKLLKENKVDIAFVNNIHHYLTPASVIPILKKNNIPIVWTLHDYVILCPNTTFISNEKLCERCKKTKYYNCAIHKCKKGSRLASIISTFESYFNHFKNPYKYVDTFICPSKFIKNKFLEYGFPDHKLTQLYNSFDEQILNDSVEVEYDKPFALYLGNILKVKGVFTLLKAVKKVDVTLLLIGDGEHFEEAKKFQQDNLITNAVFLGRKNRMEVLGYIKKSMFTILPTEMYENFPYSIVESMLLQKAVVGARMGGIPELVIDGKTGYTFEAGNEKDLSDKMKLMLKDHENTILMGKQAKNHVSVMVNQDTFYNNIDSIFKKFELK